MLTLFYFVLILYQEVLYKVFAATNFYSSIINSLFYYVAIAGILSLLNGLFPTKIAKHLLRINTFIITIWYGACLIVKKTFNITLSISALKMSDQFLGGGFINLTISVLKDNLLILGLLIIPFILSIIFSIFYKNHFKIKKLISNILTIIIAGGLFIGSLYVDVNNYGLLNLYFYQRNNNQNVEYFGVLPSLLIDIRKEVMGFEEDIVIDNEEEEDEEPVIPEVTYYAQVEDIDFDSLIENESNQTIVKMHEYFKNEKPTMSNDYTGIYEGKNLIYIMAESFDGYLVNEELTPTLYKMIHSGFDFNNYYSTTNLSTIGGEFQELTGLLPDLSMLSQYWREMNGRENYYPYGLANLFKQLNYKTYAYHNHTYSFQDRNLYLKALGFDNYIGCYSGIENKGVNCKIGFPESDVEMIDGTYPDWINDDNFMVYYATVSGHMGWDFVDNSMAIKHEQDVADMNYSDTVRAFIAANLELEDAMSHLLQILEENGKLEDTVIVLAADHHPYGLTTEEMRELAGSDIDETFELYRNNLIIYNANQEHEDIKKPCATIDILPTTLNLFGIKYDSRLFSGRDIFSSQNGLVIFSDDSWITDFGRYNNNNGVFTTDHINLSDNYEDKINNQVNNRKWAARNIMNYDYYNIVLKNKD